MLLNICCENPPSLTDRHIIFEVLDRVDYSKIDYIFDILVDGKHSQVHEHDMSIKDFMVSFLNLCDGTYFNYNVRLYLK